MELMDFVKAFVVGGLICVVGQILIDKTSLTPARILTGYVVTGVILGAVGLYPILVDFAGAGATVPLTGFGNMSPSIFQTWGDAAISASASITAAGSKAEARVVVRSSRILISS